jgi:phage I-like protein
MIYAGEYRFISPVFAYDGKIGEVERIRMAALTNGPGLDGMKAAALSSALARLDSPTKEGTQMELLQKLLATVGLPEGKTEDEALCCPRRAQGQGGRAACKRRTPRLPR